VEGLAPERYLVRAPVLFIHGEQDPYLLKDGQQGLEKLVPDLSIRRIPEGTHGVTLEKPELINQYIREFLRDA
jgi:pimeloyl-ACP methyl ester carboxylesterase